MFFSFQHNWMMPMNYNILLIFFFLLIFLLFILWNCVGSLFIFCSVHFLTHSLSLFLQTIRSHEIRKMAAFPENVIDHLPPSSCQWWIFFYFYQPHETKEVLHLVEDSDVIFLPPQFHRMMRVCQIPSPPPPPSSNPYTHLITSCLCFKQE